MPRCKLYIGFWMDDFLILARDSSDKDSFKAAIGAAFKMKDLGACQSADIMCLVM